MEEAFEGMTLTPPPPLPHRSPEPPTVTSPQYFGGDGVSWMGGLPREWGPLEEEKYIPTSFGLVHGQHCSLCGDVIDLKLHSTLCSIRCCLGKCVCLDSLVAKALLELPPASVHLPVLRLPVWVVQSFLETWPSEPSDPNWLQHSYSVDQAFATRIRGLDALLLERSQLLQKAKLVMVPVLCGAAPESDPFVACQMCGDGFPPRVFQGGCFDGGSVPSQCARCVPSGGALMFLSSPLGFGCWIGSFGGPSPLHTMSKC